MLDSLFSRPSHLATENFQLCDGMAFEQRPVLVEEVFSGSLLSPDEAADIYRQH